MATKTAGNMSTFMARNCPFYEENWFVISSWHMTCRKSVLWTLWILKYRAYTLSAFRSKSQVAMAWYVKFLAACMPCIYPSLIRFLSNSGPITLAGGYDCYIPLWFPFIMKCIVWNIASRIYFSIHHLKIDTTTPAFFLNSWNYVIHFDFSLICFFSWSLLKMCV